MFAQAVADIALGISAAFGGPYHDAEVTTQTDLEYDQGGSVIPDSGGTMVRSCSAQVDFADERMRLADGFAEKDVRILVLAATLEGDLNTSARIEVLEGDHAGTFTLESALLDAAGTYWECRGRPA